MRAAKSNRKVRNIIVDSQAQLRLLVPFVILMMLSLAVITIMYWQIYLAQVEARESMPLENILLQAQLNRIGYRELLIATVGVLAINVLALMLWLRFSHRIFGPARQIKLQIDRFCNGERTEEIRLRQTDELKEIAAALNRLRLKLNEKGMSLVEVMVVSGILAISGLVLMNLISGQSQMQKSLAQKSEMQDLKQSLLSALSNPATCACQLNPANNTSNVFPLTFDSTAATPPSIEMTTLYGGCDAANRPSFPVATEGQVLPGTQTGLKVAKIFLSNINAVGNPANRIFKAEFTVQFDPTTEVIARQPVTISQFFTADPTQPATAQQVLTCSSAPLGAGCQRVDSLTNPGSPSTTGQVPPVFVAQAQCPAGLYAISGGGDCLNWNGTAWNYPACPALASAPYATPPADFITGVFNGGGPTGGTPPTGWAMDCYGINHTHPAQSVDTCAYAYAICCSQYP